MKRMFRKLREDGWFPKANEWFPGQYDVRFERLGWLLSSGLCWNAEGLEEDIDLTAVRLLPDGRLELDFFDNVNEWSRLTFAQVSDIGADGDFSLGSTPHGWEVMGTIMIVSDLERVDGRFVYLLELSNATLCFASFPPEVTVRTMGTGE